MLRLVQEDLERARQWRLEKQAAVTAGTVTGHHQPQQFHSPQQQQQQQSYQYQQQPPAATGSPTKPRTFSSMTCLSVLSASTSASARLMSGR